jgi:hydrogenase maturation protein HypF
MNQGKAPDNNPVTGGETGTPRDAGAPQTERITLWGVVQGVGFRPFVAKLAHRLGMSGEVQNTGGLARISLTDTAPRIDAFLRLLYDELPPPAEIVRQERFVLPALLRFEGFSISESAAGDDETSMLPADLPVCESCLAEMRDPANPRWMHPFISCMSCGPRYTIVDRVPYDRDNTSMESFPMCALCASQYGDRENRRYHAQTISCHDCGPMLLWEGNEDVSAAISPAALVLKTGLKDNVKVPKKLLDKVFEPLARAENAILTGGVVALKGVGGYCFVCSPFDEIALLRLREIKVREEKPFAVMFACVDAVRAHCRVSAAEESLLVSRARPIVLLERKDAGDAPDTGLANPRAAFGPRQDRLETEESAGGRAMSPELCGSSRYIGAFLPAMGLQYMMTEDLGPLVMTSANLSDLPMIKDDGEMLRLMKKQPLIAGALYNGRDIRAHMDDSVVCVSDGRAQTIRRAKGYVPAPVFADRAEGLTKDDMIWATGGQLKSTFALTKGKAIYVSRYFGDLDTTEAETAYLEGFARMRTLFRIEPRIVVRDLHPLYATTRMAEEYAAHGGARDGRAVGHGDAFAARSFSAERSPIEILCVQHHHAHIASVMAEHNLDEPVIGVAFDGTGYGTDGKIWGGEFLLCAGGSFRRMAHLRYVRMIGGDSSMKEAWKSALCYAYALGAGGAADGKDRAADFADPVGAPEAPETFSVDISEILAYGDISEHPLRGSVFAALRTGVNTVECASVGRLFDAVSALLDIGRVNRYEGECAILLENAAARAMSEPGRSRKDDLALRFHRDVAAMILKACASVREKTGVSAVALSGGVFQNRVLTDAASRLLRESDFSVYRNVVVPSNDGGISLGQAYVGMRRLTARNGPIE